MGAKKDPVSRDIMYRARHSEIAQMVFERALGDQEKRFEEYVRCLKSMNLTYEVDDKAFSEMVKAYSLMELFSSYDMIDQIYDAAIEVGGDEAHVFHQRGIYQMRRSSPDFELAEEFLQQAHSLRPYNSSIKHTLAELSLAMSKVAKTDVEREHRLIVAADAAKSLCRGSRTSHPHTTLVKIGLARMRSAFNVQTTSERDFQTLIQDCEDSLSAGISAFPESQPLLKLCLLYTSPSPRDRG